MVVFEWVLCLNLTALFVYLFAISFSFLEYVLSFTRDQQEKRLSFTQSVFGKIIYSFKSIFLIIMERL